MTAELIPLELIHPFRMIVAGPSGCGKTVFTNALIKSHLIDDINFNEIIWCYSEIGSLRDRIPYVTYQEGLPSVEQYDGTRKLVILDDLMHETNTDIAKLFTKMSHHRNVSVILITQNVFFQSKNSRDISLNNNYLVIFKNPRDKAQVMHLAKQIRPGQTKFFMKSFEDATETPHGYLFIDFKPRTPEIQRLASDITHEHPMILTP
jgi:hypothetical protein